jgi:hypothetical protein
MKVTQFSCICIGIHKSRNFVEICHFCMNFSIWSLCLTFCSNVNYIYRHTTDPCVEPSKVWQSRGNLQLPTTTRIQPRWLYAEHCCTWPLPLLCSLSSIRVHLPIAFAELISTFILALHATSSKSSRFSTTTTTKQQFVHSGGRSVSRIYCLSAHLTPGQPIRVVFVPLVSFSKHKHESLLTLCFV